MTPLLQFCLSVALNLAAFYVMPKGNDWRRIGALLLCGLAGTAVMLGRCK